MSKRVSNPEQLLALERLKVDRDFQLSSWHRPRKHVKLAAVCHGGVVR